MKIDSGTLVRTILLILAWVNQILAMNHISPIPVDEMTISTVITGIISLIAWWKNNNFSHAAKKGQEKIHEVKAGTNSTGGAPQMNGDDF
ncbi:phage holin [Staphylococcus caprae]|nr:holin [Staphylococcus phage IME1323_01]PAK64080.1 phage holin [Staphylococcus caprae]